MKNELRVKRLTEWMLGLREDVAHLPRHKFNMSQWITKLFTYSGTPLEDCSSAACGAGWLPAIFPKSWYWTANGLLRLRGAKRVYGSSPVDRVAEFFGIERHEAERITLPKRYIRGYYSSMGTGEHIRVEAVAKRIEDLIVKYEAQG